MIPASAGAYYSSLAARPGPQRADTSLPLVLVVGALGSTGRSITRGMLYSGKFRVAAMVRPVSMNKPLTEQLRKAGVDIRPGDLHDGVDRLKTVLRGVSILVSAVGPDAIADQKDLFRAARAVGVQRVVPSEWGTPGAEGVIPVRDAKIAIRSFLAALRLPCTVIDIGWRMQTFLPLPPRSRVDPRIRALTHRAFAFAASADPAHTLLTDLNAVGAYVARVLADPRTSDRMVIVWEDERPVSAAAAAGERFSGEGPAMRSQRATITEQDLTRLEKEAHALLAAGGGAHPDAEQLELQIWWCGFARSVCVLRENTLENARRLGYVDARALYPDIRASMLEEFAGRFYRMKDPSEGGWM
ncbi:NAD-P-binding protein [Epithele typhae]|uniref:NAD-P-binding protein n=1 Tax=Epithele typhae TaxID=378194 RepID=UPI002007D5F4|nr:NAD-P-binding protein [Epithele typhae]KAH9925886.1 NAD-P-binding protein [Epithele typhae]